MKKQKKSNKKVKMSTVGIVLIVIGVIGLLGTFSETEDVGSLIIGSLVLLAAGIGLVYIDKKRSKMLPKTSTKINSTKTLDYIKSLDSVAKTEDSVKPSSVTKKTSTTASTSNFTPSSTLKQEKVVPDGEKDYNLIPDYYEGNFLAYEYEQQICFIKDETLDEKFGYVIGNGGKQLLFEFEPENQYDCMAIAIYLNDKKLGYVYSGRTQDMMHDYYRKGWEVCAHINKYSIENKTATYKVGFFKPIDRFESKQFSLVKTTKKIDEYSNRADNLSCCNEGDVLTIECDDIIDENYVVYTDTYEEIGELPKSANAFIDEYNPKKIMGILNSCEEDENGKLKAKITVYLLN